MHCQFFEDGSPRHAEFYVNGKRSGNFWASGQVRTRERREGAKCIKEWFYLSGALQKRIVTDKAGKHVEPVRLFHENSQLAEEIHMQGTDPFGLWMKFFDDGSLKLQAEYLKERSLVVRNAGMGPSTHTGCEEWQRTFLDNEPDIYATYELFSECRWPTESELKGGVPHGLVKGWHGDTLRSTGEYRRGVPHGEHTSYWDWDNGRRRTVTRYHNGKVRSSENFPKFDDPQPSVVLSIEASERLFTAWRHVLPDEYPVC